MDNKTKKGFKEFISAVIINDITKVRNMFRIENLNMRDFNGDTPLSVACWIGHTDIVRYLLDRGSNIECDNNIKRRPIHIAAYYGHTSVVTELINRKCLVTSIDKDGQTALDIALRLDNTECAALLYEAMKNPHPDHIPSIDDFTNKQFLGSGGFGQVYKCLDSRLQRYVAIKEVRGMDSNKLASLEKEVDIFQRLPLHANIVRYHGTMKDEEKMYIVMEYVDGESLKDKLIRLSNLDPISPLAMDLIATYSYQILQGLKFLHKNNIIHRDIKSLNILINTKDYLKLCDFGVSRYLSPVDKTTETTDCLEREMASTCIGSAYWMAPEVLTEDRYTFSADVWSLGATVVEMLTGHPPYHDFEPQRAQIKIAMTKKAEYKCLRTIPDDLQSFLEAMFVADPSKRATVESSLESTFIIERKVTRHFDDGVFVDDFGYNMWRYGGFMNICKFEDTRINEYYVTRRLRIDIVNNDEVNSLRDAIEIYKTMSKHPNIVQYLVLFVTDYGIDIISEYVDGMSMIDMLEKDIRTTINDCARYTKQLLEGLHFLHGNNIIHGNIKASNIIVNINGTVKLSDHGLMMYLGRLYKNRKYKSKFDEYIFSHSYWMAPETILEGHYTVYSDVWSVAVTMTEMLTGRPIYYPKVDAKDVIKKIVDTNNIKDEYPPFIPNELRNLLDSIFVYDPTERPIVETLLGSEFIATYSLQ